ncbi:MAG: HAD-IA family hydrolase [Betaproteobacteria bacterium]
MPSALLLDLDDTLIDDRGAMADAVLLFRKTHNLCCSEEDHSVAARWDEVGRSLWRRMALGEVTFIEQRRLRLKETFDIAPSDAEADSLFNSYLGFYERTWRLMPGAQAFLNHTAHLPRAIVTNGLGAQARKKLDRLGLTKHFQVVVTPDDCGVRKPDLRFFNYALDLLGVKAEDVLMIGDSEEADIAPALLLGMKAFHVSPHIPGRSIEDAAHAAKE